MNQFHVAAGISLGSAITFVIILAMMHVLKPELEPSWRMISEYENGRFGWLMRLGFLILCLSCVSLALALLPLFSLGGILALFVAGTSLIGAAIWAPDPATTPPNDRTQTGHLHSIFGGVFILGFPLATALLCFGLNQTGQHVLSGTTLRWLATLVWCSMVWLFGAIYYYVGIKRRTGDEVRIGWPNRVMLCTYLAWIIALASMAVA